MDKSIIKVNPNKRGRGRPKTTGRGSLVGVRLHEPMLSDLDAYRGDLSRPEAIRRLIKLGLSK